MKKPRLRRGPDWFFFFSMVFGRSFEVVTPKGVFRYESAEQAVSGAIWLGLTYKPEHVYARECYWFSTRWLGGTEPQKAPEGENPNRIAVASIAYLAFVTLALWAIVRFAH